jgi:aspartyl-tRNA(Asn)/glutamyl-tRNA(Gln) amidotransferase subunit B
VDSGRWTGDNTGIEAPASTPSTVHRPPSTVRIHHIHLEEDAGKSLHDQDAKDSLVDLNRAGVPLLEIVTEPDLRSAEEVASFMETMRRLVRWLGVSDGNMEEGSLRCDVNVSVRKQGDPVLGQRCEIKNVNSMRFARRAVEYETKRQIEILENGGRIEQETRGFDAVAGTTYSLREKEQAHDYRYFPEPDLPPVIIHPEELERIRAEMPPLPDALEREFQTRYSLSAYDAQQLTQDRATAFYFLTLAGMPANPKLASNLLINKLIPWAAENNATVAECPVSAAHWTEFLQLIESGQLSASTAYQRLFPALLDDQGASPARLAADLNLLQNSDAGFLEALADEVLARFPDKVQEYKKGKKGLIGLFMGELMKASKGKADPKMATKVLEGKLMG